MKIDFKEIGVGFTKYLLAPLVAASLSAFAVQYHADQTSEKRTKEERATLQFKDQSRAFEAATANYVRRILDDQKPNEDATKQLQDNIFAQMRSIEDAAPYLEKQDRRLADDYKEQLLGLSTAIPRVGGVLSMKVFWERVSKVLVLRNDILSKLPA